MSYDDRMTVVRCHTILDDVLGRDTIIDEVVRRRRTTIAQILYDGSRRRTMSCRKTSHDHLKISHTNENRRKVLNMTKSCQDMVKLTPGDCDVVQRRMITHDLLPDGLRSP